MYRPRLFAARPLLGLLLVIIVGAGVWSSAESASAQGGPPTKPAVHTITGLHQGLRVYWYESSGDGGSATTGYEVHYRAKGAKAWTDARHTGTSQPAVITGLSFNTTYEVRVRALNANGAGPWSTVESRRTARNDGRPDQPWPPRLTPGAGQVEVSWSAPDYTGGRAITGYHVRYTTDAAATWQSWAPRGNRLITGTTTTISGLGGGVTVGVVVAAVNARGQGGYSSPIADATPASAASPPPAPSLRLTPLGGALRVSWSAVSAQPQVSAYELQYQSIAWKESNWPVGWTASGASLGADAILYLHEELSPDRRYRYRLRASNDAGAGEWSAVVPQAGLQPRPGRPTLRAHTAASGSVKLSWIKGPASATPWAYRWLREDGVWGHWTRIAGSNAETTEHVVSGLTEDVRYQFLLRAYNASGAGSASDPVSAVAGLTPTVPSQRETLFYDDLDSAGSATEDGSYAFLSDADDLTSGATSFAQIGNALALLLNTTGYAARDYTDTLANVQVGDKLTWLPYGECWYHFRVTAILSQPPLPTRQLFRIQPVAQEQCGFTTAQEGATSYLGVARANVASFEWGSAPNEPVVGSDGIRILPEQYPVEGGHTYRLTGWDRPTRVVIDLPAGIRLQSLGGTWDHYGGLFVTYRDLASGAWFWLYPHSGKHAGFYVPIPEGATEPPRDVVDRFEELVDSIRVQASP